MTGLKRKDWIQREISMARDSYVNPTDTTIHPTDTLILYSIIRQVDIGNVTQAEKRTRLIRLAALIIIEIEQLDGKEGKK